MGPLSFFCFVFPFFSFFFVVASSQDAEEGVSDDDRYDDDDGGGGGSGYEQERCARQSSSPPPRVLREMARGTGPVCEMLKTVCTYILRRYIYVLFIFSLIQFVDFFFFFIC